MRTHRALLGLGSIALLGVVRLLWVNDARRVFCFTHSMQKRVRLTCKCGASYMLHTILDFRDRCANEHCRAVPNMSAEDLWKYQESLIALMAALGLSRDYEPELNTAQRISQRLASFQRIEVV